MAMMIRNFFRHIGESLKNMKRNGWMTVAAVSSVMITLVLVGAFLSVIMNVSKLASGIENNVRIVAYTNLDIHDQSQKIVDPKDNAKQIENPNYKKIYDQISKVADIKTIKFSSREEQLKQLTETIPTYKLFKGDANPLYDAYIIEAATPGKVQSVAKNVGQISGINKVNYGGSNTKQIFAFAKAIRLWGLGGAILLLLVAIFLIQNTIRITIMSRQREIQIMRLVGAKNGYIRWPFFLEGAWVGLLGSIVPSVLMAWVYRVAFISFAPTLHTQQLTMYTPSEFIPMIVGIMVVIGVLIGSFGALLSMRRFLKI